MTDKLMYISRWYTNDPFCRLQLVVEKFGHSTSGSNQPNSIKVPKTVKPTQKESYYKTLGTRIMNNTISSPSLGKI